MTPTLLDSAPDDLFYPLPKSPLGLIGLPRLMETALRGVNLGPIGHSLIERSDARPDDSNALMDLSCVMVLTGHEALAQRLQADALAISRSYALPAQAKTSLRVLLIKTAGSLMVNMPVEFLLQGSSMHLDMVYAHADDGADALRDLPPHDVACMGVCESAENAELLALLQQLWPSLPKPTLNHPARTAALRRDNVWRLLAGTPGCLMPPTVRVNRQALTELAQGRVSLQAVLPQGRWPLICRPRGSHAGIGLSRLGEPAELARYLAEQAGEDDFYLSTFVDYVAPDGQYRKVRIALVGGKPYPVHMALSARWMVHYLNGDMSERPDNRAIEAEFFDRFEQDFARRHAAALAGIDERLGLDYCSIDCAEGPDGRLLVFEADTGGVVHAMDPLEGYGYKRPHMLRLFAAFQALLARAAQDPSCLKACAAVHEGVKLKNSKGLRT